MRQFLITMAGVFAGLLLFCFIVPFALIAMIAGSSPKAPVTPPATVLQLDLRSPITDQRHLSFLGGSPISTIEIVRKLDAAAKDDRVKGIYIRGAASGLDPAQAEEIHGALARLRAAKKFVISHLQNDGAEMSLLSYEAISGSSEIWLQETGDFMPMGILSQRMYLGGALKKFHVTAQFEARREYKDAINEYTERGPTPASREATTAMLASIYDSAVASVAADRKMDVAHAKSVIEATPYSSADAIKVGLADKLGRPEDAAAAALDQGGKGAQLLDLSKYSPARPTGPTIALVTAEGDIVSGPNQGPSFTGGSSISSDEISKALIDASNDKDVKAIIFRVSSPGGSAVASDQIAHAVELAQQHGKKVVVSMGPYAASGGYYISAGADRIVADASTITGSIGIFGGKIVIGEALDHYAGVTFDTNLVGSPNIAMFDSSKPFTPAQQKVFAAIIDRGYADFKNVVATGRKLTPDKVEEIARGRVWTGVQAKERGLVDEIGGLDAAIAAAKSLSGLKADAKVQLKLFPQRRSIFEQLQGQFGMSAEAARALAAVSTITGDEKLVQALEAVSAHRREGLQARAEPIWVH